MAGKLDGKRIAFVVAPEGVEQVELTEPWKAVEEAGGRPELLSIDDGVRRGDWTPQYLRHSSAPAVTARLGGDAPIFVVLRDPVERFRSAMRLAATRGKSWPYPVPITVQTWTGFYADQLAMWAAAVGRERLHVLVYEAVRADPQAAVDGLWRAIGVEPVPLQDVARESASSSRAEWDWTPGLEESLRVLYRPQVERLASEWGLDVSPWATAR